MFGVEGLGFRVIGVPLAVVDVRSCFVSDWWFLK